jgi:hypothetical protein
MDDQRRAFRTEVSGQFKSERFLASPGMRLQAIQKDKNKPGDN